MLPYINPLPIVITIAAALGILFHDTQFDHAASAALMTPVSLSSYGSVETALHLNDQHTHVERVSFSNSQPVTQPRSDDKKYILQKKLVSTTFGSEYSWPSI